MASFADLLFYMFSSLLVVGATMVIATPHAVYAVLYLIFSFFNAAALFLLLGAEFVAMILLIVYVGAVAVLFLFVVMMVESDLFERRHHWFKPYKRVALCLGAVSLLEVIFYLFQQNPSKGQVMLPPYASANVAEIGNILYTTYFYPFQIMGLLLLTGIISAITLTLRHCPSTKRQSVLAQLQRDPRQSAALVTQPFREGVDT